MIVDEHVLDRLARVLADSGLGEDVGLRLEKDGEQFALRPDRPQSEDQCFRQRGRVVLIVGPEEAQRLDGRRLELDG